MMMEWEPVNHNNTMYTNPNAFDYHQQPQKQQQAASVERKNEEERQWNTEALAGLLNTTDVLLGEPCVISKYVKGTPFYWRQIDRHRQQYLDSRDPFQQDRIVERIVESVWEHDGRFLMFDSRNGTLSIVPKNALLLRVRRDLRQNPKNRLHNKPKKIVKSKAAISAASTNKTKKVVKKAKPQSGNKKTLKSKPRNGTKAKRSTATNKKKATKKTMNRN